MSELAGDQSAGIERRELLTGLLIGVAFVAQEAHAAETPSAAPPGQTASPRSVSPEPVSAPFLVLNDAAAQFLTLAVDILIPADDLSPSAGQCGVVTFIDRQLASAWAAGAGSYRQGPFQPGTPEQGEQHPLAPREFILAGIAAVQTWVLASTGQSFANLAPAARIAALKQVESGQASLEGIEGRPFFDALLQLTMEGYFADPIYGGNRAMAGWSMLGFPGLPAFYAADVAANRGKRYVAPPQSIADFL